MKISEVEGRINASYNTIKKFVESSHEYYVKKNNVIHVTDRGLEELERKYGVKSEILDDSQIDFYKNQIIFLRQQLEEGMRYNQLFLKQLEVKDSEMEKDKKMIKELEEKLHKQELKELELKYQIEIEKNKSIWQKIFSARKEDK